eukprot:3044514-Prymnesium_polylepis.1
MPGMQPEAQYLQASDSSHTGSKPGPSRHHKPDGIGFFDHIEPAGIVPSDTRQPSNSSCVLLSPSHRRIDLPTKSSGISRNVSSVSGAWAGAKR